MKYEKTILVTGGAGFIGSSFLNVMVLKYPTYYFVNLDALTSVASVDNVEVADAPNYTFVQGDIRDRDVLDGVFNEYPITDIIHFAAETHVDVSITNPNIFIETNVLGTHNLLAYARTHGIHRFHFVSTDEVYGSLSQEDIPFHEGSLLEPNSPYSASKAAAENLVRAYNKTYGLDTIITRCSNNYGPRQDRSKLIPLFITNLLTGKSAPLYAKGENIRDWIHVDDHVRALDAAFHNGRSGEIYNIGGNNELRNVDIATLLVTLTGRDADAIVSVEDRPGHDFRYAINSDKSMREFDWQPLIPFDEGLRSTVTWYRERL